MLPESFKNSCLPLSGKPCIFITDDPYYFDA